MFSKKSVQPTFNQPKTSTIGSGGAKQENFLVNFVLGGLSGCIAKTSVAPLDRIKLIQQTATSQPNALKHRSQGITKLVRNVVKHEGVMNLWKGNGANVMKVFPMNAFSLALKDLFGKFIYVNNPEQNKAKFLLASMLSGGLAGGCTVSVVFPLDFVRTKLSTDMLQSGGKRQYNGIMDCFKKTIKTDGIKGMYRGISMALTGVFLSKALTLGTYDFLKQTTLKGETSFWKKYAIANVVTQCTGMMLYPLDTVGRQLMMQSGSKIKKFNGPVDCMKKLYQKNGIRGFYKGCMTDCMTGLGTSLILVLYEDAKKALSGQSH